MIRGFSQSIEGFLADPAERILVIKVAIGGKTPRITEHPQHIARGFC